MANGFILEPVLILFTLALLFCAYASVMISSRAQLIQAGRRSALDRAVIEQAKYIAGEKAWKRRCFLEMDEENDQTVSNQTIQNHDVVFTDRKTYIECRYSDKGCSYQIDVYYDENGVIKTEYTGRRSD